MTKSQLVKFLEYLRQQYLVFAPQRVDGELVFDRLENARRIEITNELPLHSFKRFLVPPRETLFNYEKNKIRFSEVGLPKIRKSDFRKFRKGQVLFGLTIVDLKAITMLDQVFAKDPYYQKRQLKTLIIGHNLMPADSGQFFLDEFEEHILEHLKFDVFLVIQRNQFKVYAGSDEGIKVLEDFGYKDFEYIEYVGPVREEGPDKQMLRIKEAMEKEPEHPLWEKLGKICIECGKCTMICPTCFCFDIDDKPGLDAGTGKRIRSWGCCFYTDFSEVAGLAVNKMKPKFLKNTAERIKFWYEHKFVRIPQEFNISGCVGCGRCTKICPVGIDIKRNLQKLLKGRIK